MWTKDYLIVIRSIDIKSDIFTPKPLSQMSLTKLFRHLNTFYNPHSLFVGYKVV